MDLREKAIRAAQRSNPLDEAVRQRDRNALTMVERALAHKEVILAFQPIYASRDMAQPAFYESLLRVLDETGRVIPARDFMPFVAHSETSRTLDCLSLEMSLLELKRNAQLCLSVNMSARSIGYSDWRNQLTKALAETPEIASRLILEISESSVMEMPEVVNDFMSEMLLYKVRFALDEYGSGPTSYDLLRDFFFDFIKLDGSFSTRIHEDPENQVLAGAIARMTRALGIQSIATQVEHRQEAKALGRLGFAYFQGYYFGAPTISPPWNPVKLKQAVA